MIYVLSDIHGNSKRFDSIMEQINLQSEDTLYILGDVIDRYPDGIRILRRIMAMPNVKMLLGNHEYMMLNSLDNDAEYFRRRSMHLWYKNGGDVTHNYIKHIRKTVRREIFDYLRSLPVNIDVTVNDIKYKLVHGAPVDNIGICGGFYHSQLEYSVWERWHDGDHVPDGYTLILGHTPTINFEHRIPMEVWFGDRAIAIDCGAGYPNFAKVPYGMGRLACVRLDDMKIFYSKEDEFEDA